MFGASVVVGVGESTYFKRGGATESEFQLACIAIRNAVADAGLQLKDVKGFVSYMDRNEPVRLSAALGVGDLDFTAQTFGGGGNGAGAAVTLADMAITAGYADCVVVFRALAQGQFHRYGQAGKARRARGVGAYTAPYGMLSAAQICAMQTMRYMHDHDIDQDALAEVVLACYEHAQHNPRAVRYGRPITREEYHSSRWIAEPFHLYDCCPENDGAAAIVVASKDFAKNCAKPGVAIVAAAHGLEHRDGVGAFNEVNFPTAHHRHVGRKLWERAGCGPKDVPVAQFYENFTGPVLMAMAEMGFCHPDELNEFVANGNICWPNGELPINTSGGNLGEGYIHGFGNIVEAVRQVRGESTCQVGGPGGAELSLSVSGPGFSPGSAVLFGKA